MDPSQDNPIVRFKAFFWSLSIFALFGVLLVLIALPNRKAPVTLEDDAAVARYQTRHEVDQKQEEKIAYKVVEEGKTVAVKPVDVFAHVAATLATSKPIAVETPAQVVPGSDAQKALEAAAANAAPVVIAETDPNAPLDPKVMEEGKTQFMTCGACHGAEGAGTPGLAPPLAKSEWVVGPVENPIRIVLRGLEGPIKVEGVDYDLPAPMAAFSYLNDDQVAAVITYIRNSFGNKASAVTADQVKAFRGEVGRPALKAADLKAVN